MLGFDAVASLPIADDAMEDALADRITSAAIRGGVLMGAEQSGGTRITASISSTPRIKVGS